MHNHDPAYNYRVTPGWYPTARRPYAGLVYMITITTASYPKGYVRSHWWHHPLGFRVSLKIIGGYDTTTEWFKMFFLRKRIATRRNNNPGRVHFQSMKIQIELILIGDQHRRAQSLMPSWFAPHYPQFRDRGYPPTDQEISSLITLQALAQ